MTERYNRHNLIDWFSQEQLAKAKIAVIGAGAVGNEVIKNLCLLGVGEVHIYDYDIIEEHNLTRSVLFRDSDIGLQKAAVAARQAIELDPFVSAHAICSDFWDVLSISELQTFDVLFCCVDNYEARIRCNTLCYIAKVDFVNVGIDSRSSLIELFPFSMRSKQACIECNLPETVYRRISERYSCGHLKKISHDEKKVPTTIITSSVAASLAVSSGLRLGSRSVECVESVRIYLDTITGSLTRSTLSNRDDCPCCGRIPNNALVIRCKREVRALPRRLGYDPTIVTSEPILVAYRIMGEEREQIVFRRASEFDESYPATLASDPGQVELEVRDQFTLGELADRFDGHDIPSKFVMVSEGNKVIICEFEGGASE